MQTLNFSYNWNKKLDCKFFTTLRLSGRLKIGETIQLTFNVWEEKIQQVIVRGKKRLKFNQINEFIAGLDTGYSVEETKNILKKMYPNVDWNSQTIYLYLLETKK